MLDYPFQKVMRLFCFWIFLWILSGVSCDHLKLEPPGTSHAFFTGDGFFITCSADEYSGATRLTWQGPNGRDIMVTQGRLYVQAAPHNPLGLQLVIEDVRYKDRGLYTCSAVVDGTEIRNSFDLVVHQSIVFWGTPKEQHGNEGGDFLMPCNVRSEPTALVSWYANGTPITNGTKHLITEDGLYFRHLRRTDTGNYTCRAFVVTPHSSQLKDLHIHLDVHYRPVWHIPHMETAYGMIGGYATLICEAHAQPPPTFEWFRDKTLIGNSQIYKITNSEYKSILRIKINDQNAFGNFQCFVSNSLGDAYKYIALFEGVYPSPPKLKVSSQDPGSLWIEVTPISSDPLPVHLYKVEYRMQSLSWGTGRDHYINIGRTALIQDLNFEEVYNVRAKTKNAVGYSNFSEEVSQRTRGPVAETVLDSPGVSSLSNDGSQSKSLQVFHHATSFTFTISVLMSCLPIWRSRWL